MVNRQPEALWKVSIDEFVTVKYECRRSEVLANNERMHLVPLLIIEATRILSFYLP